MTTRASLYAREPAWDEYKNRKESYEFESQGSRYRPLHDAHRLLHDRSPRHSPANDRSTPPVNLPRLHTPEDHRHGSQVRGTRYDVIPPVHPRDRPGYDEDSWGEEASSDEEPLQIAPPTQTYPYPMMMYPMVMPMMQPQAQKPKPKKHRGEPKKRVRYRNTPVVINIPEDYPRQVTQSKERYKAPLTHPKRSTDYDPFDPRSNSVLDRYEAYPHSLDRNWEKENDNMIERFKHEKHMWSEDTNRNLGPAFRYLDSYSGVGENFVEDFIEKELRSNILPDVAIDALTDSGKRPTLLQSDVNLFDNTLPGDDRVARLLTEDILEDVVFEGSIDCVREATHEMVDHHLNQTAQINVINDMVSEIIAEHGHKWTREAINEFTHEKFMDEEVIGPEVYDLLKELSIETLHKTSDRVRRQEIKQVEDAGGDRQTDSLALDYLLSMVARQGNLWTEGEHANRLMDDMMLTVLIEQLFNVESRKKATLGNKPLKRLHEKVFTDVAADVLLDELAQSLDEDLTDLDEFEQGLAHPDITKAPAQLQKLLWHT